MLTLSFRRKTFALLLLVMVVTFPMASAANSRPASQGTVQSVEPAGFEFLGRIWTYLKSRIAPSSPVKEGCDINPDGRCKAQIIRATPAELGCDIDPNGRCRA
jgi:hypothetical protein